MGHKEIKSRRADRTLLFGLGQNQLPGCQAHDFPKEQKDQRIPRRHDPQHRKNEGEIVDLIVLFSLNMRQISPGIEEIGKRTQQDKTNENKRKGIEYEHKMSSPKRR